MKGKVLMPILLAVVLAIGGTVSLVARHLANERKAQGVDVNVAPSAAPVAIPARAP